jgi:chromosome segregation ATPase
LVCLQEDQKKSDALKRDMTRLDEVKTEMNNAVHHAGQGHPKTLWSKFFLKDRKTCIDALEKKRTVERQFHATQQSLNQLNQRINKINQEMEGRNIDKAKLDDEMEELQSKQNSLDGILKEKVNNFKICTTSRFSRIGMFNIAINYGIPCTWTIVLMRHFFSSRH